MPLDREIIHRGTFPRRRRPSAEALERRRLLATIIVDSAGDGDGATGDGLLSLRQAIQISNGTLPIASLDPGQRDLVEGSLSSPNTILFRLPGAGPFTIRPVDRPGVGPRGLPPITSPVIIDGYSQSGAFPNSSGPGFRDNATILVELDGTLAGFGASGLEFHVGGNTVQGLAIGNFTRPDDLGGGAAGIRIEAGGGDVIRGNFIGTDASGTVPRGNHVGILAPGDVTIGGTTPDARNIISANVVGLSLGASPGGFLVQGNLIGTDATGTNPLGNGLGVSVSGKATIGGTIPEARNVISGNRTGLDVEAAGLGVATLQGNFIGTDVSGRRPLANTDTGVRIGGSGNMIGGAAAGAGNLIAFNGGRGVDVVFGFDTIFFSAFTKPFRYHTGTAGEFNTVSGNAIFSNAGGDLIMSASDTGGPDYSLSPHHPAIRSAVTIGSRTVISGVFDGPIPAVDVTIELFSSPGVGPGQTFLGSTTVAADGSFTFVAGSDLGGQFVTGTATIHNGTTSDFNPPILVAPSATTARLVLASTGVITTRDRVVLEGVVAPVSGLGVPGRPVTLLEDGMPVTAGPMTSDLDAAGHFLFDLPPLLAGPHIFTVAFAGTPSFGASESPPLIVTVTQAEATDPTAVPLATSTTIDAFPAPHVAGRPFVLGATVAASPGVGVPDGLVTFRDGNRVLGQAPLDPSGHASIVIIAPEGLASYAAEYAGSPQFSTSLSAVSTASAARVSATIVLVGPPILPVAGQTIAFTAIVASGGATPTGSVAFMEGGVVLAVVSLDDLGRATFFTSALPAGRHDIAAAYFGDASDAPTRSNIVTQGVLAAGPAVTSARSGAGRAAPKTVVLTFSGPLLIGPAQDTANYRIIGPGGRVVRITSATYNPATRSVTLKTGRRIDPQRSYRLKVTAGVVGDSGTPLDGLRNGTSGGNFSGTLTRHGLASAKPHPGGPHRKR